MTRELIIEGQSVDLALNTDITLEYTSNFPGDIGKLNLSHSYTIKLPKTLRNARILDDPGNLGHDSNATRRHLAARYYRNGIDLMGPMRAYILKTAADGYEIALVQDAKELREIVQSDKMLNDLPNLPVLTWVDSSNGLPDYYGKNDKDGAVFAEYQSGLGAFPPAGYAPHPSMKVENLIDRILEGCNYSISEAARATMRDIVILAAPSHTPSLSMETESGTNWNLVYYTGAYLDLGSLEYGWDAVPADENLFTPGKRKVRLLINVIIPTSKGAEAYMYVRKSMSENGTSIHTTEFTRYAQPLDTGEWALYVDELIDGEEGAEYIIETVIPRGPDDPDGWPVVPAKPGLPRACVYYVHDAINLQQDNRFPLEGNLPKIKQWDFIKSCAALFGWELSVNNGTLRICTHDETIEAAAYDWTSKVDIPHGEQADLAYTLSGWARRNTIAYKTDETNDYPQSFDLVVLDDTINEERVYYEVPFAASRGDAAVHYEILPDNTVKDIKIQPRIMKLTKTDTNVQVLAFAEELQGPQLKTAHYAKVQEIVRKPIVISVNMRLHELDLAQIDLTRPVYLGQFGHYYKILKVQTSATDLCKVELLQIA